VLGLPGAPGASERCKSEVFGRMGVEGVRAGIGTSAANSSRMDGGSYIQGFCNANGI
jgi:hypothetical protein